MYLIRVANKEKTGFTHSYIELVNVRYFTISISHIFYKIHKIEGVLNKKKLHFTDSYKRSGPSPFLLLFFIFSESKLF